MKIFASSILVLVMTMASVEARINVTHPTNSSGWYAGQANVFSWTNASYGHSDRYPGEAKFTPPNPFAFNFTLYSPHDEDVYVEDHYRADFGSFNGTSGIANIDLSSLAQEATYVLQVFFLDAESNTMVVIGDSENFTIQATPGHAIKPFKQYDPAKNSWSDNLATSNQQPSYIVSFVFPLLLLGYYLFVA